MAATCFEQFLPLVYDELDDSLKLKAEIELNENEASIPNEIEQLKSMIKKHELPCCVEDNFLICFLRGKKHDVNRSFEQLKNYSEIRHNYMNLFGFMFFRNLLKPIENGVVGLLPKRDAEGRVIMYIRLSEWNPSVCDSEDVIRAIQSVSHFPLAFPATQINGFSIIFDFKVASLNVLYLAVKYIRLLSPSLKISPTRIKKVCVVNSNFLVQGLSRVLLAITPAKLRERTAFYGDPRTTLPKVFHPSILPEEFGGTMGTINTLYKEWLDDYEKFLPKFQETNKHYKRKNTIIYPETEEAWITSSI